MLPCQNDADHAGVPADPVSTPSHADASRASDGSDIDQPSDLGPIVRYVAGIPVRDAPKGWWKEAGPPGRSKNDLLVEIIGLLRRLVDEGIRIKEDVPAQDGEVVP